MNRRSFVIVGLLIVIVVVIIVGTVLRRQVATSKTLAIIVVTHREDAVRSLGGFMTLHQGPILIADFFDSATTSTSSIEGATVQMYTFSDSTYGSASSAEESDLAKSVQALIVGNGGKQISIYGPAIFGQGIGDHDADLLHDAFMDAVNGLTASSTSPYIYENFPQVEQFQNAVVYSLQKNLEDESPALVFTEVNIPLNSYALSTKQKTLQLFDDPETSADLSFTSSRCGIDPNQACEVVYGISEF